MSRLIFTIVFDLFILGIYGLGIYIGSQDFSKVIKHTKWIAFGMLTGEIMIIILNHMPKSNTTIPIFLMG